MKNLNIKAFSIIEYAILIVIIVGAYLVMQSYIQRGIFGNWGQTGQSFGFGRQYDPQKTIECAYDEQSNLWYDRNCFLSLSNYDCTYGNVPACQEGIITGGQCSQSSCTQLNQ